MKVVLNLGSGRKRCYLNAADVFLLLYREWEGQSTMESIGSALEPLVGLSG